MASRAGLEAGRGLQARGTGTHPTLGVTGAAVAAAAGFVASWPPHSRGALTGAVIASPAWHTLAPVGGHTAAMDTLVGTERDTSPVAFVVALTASEAPAMVRLYHLTVHGPVDNRGPGAGVGALPGPAAGL